MDHERLLQRFLRYVAVDTTAVEGADVYPSSPGQLELGRQLAAELREMGAAEVEQDQHGLVWALIPATPGCEQAPTVAFNSHLDTSPETTGANVRPQVIRDYPGGDLTLPGDSSKVIRVADNPELTQLRGCTLITTDGTTLLGGDDKAGVAVIVELAEQLLEDSSIPHGPVRVLLTCDEEIGLGVRHVPIDKVGAAACYTLDGGGAGDIDLETFSADLAVVVVKGVNIHPSIAKDRMVNALRAAGAFLDALPRDLSPEATEGRQGFMHPYHVAGGVAEAKIHIILRDFETDALRQQQEQLRRLADDVASRHAGVAIEVDVRPQYRNLREGLAAEPRAVEFAEQAMQKSGLEPRRTIVRGGTDGSQLTEQGLPTPNLSTGQHNPHSPLEWACLDEMGQAVAVLRELVQLWGRERL